VKKNTGSDTAGVDKRTIADLAELSEEEYVRLIRKQFSNYEQRDYSNIDFSQFYANEGVIRDGNQI